MKLDKLTDITDDKQWDEFVASAPVSHPFQLSAWSKIKAKNGWASRRVGIISDGMVLAGAQILFLKAPITGYKMAYIPRGPLVVDSRITYQDLLDVLAMYCKDQQATLLKIEPALENQPLSGTWREAKQQILHPETSIIELKHDSEDALIMSLKSGARRDIRKAYRQEMKAETVTTDRQLEEVLKLYRETAERAGFKLYSQEYYHAVYQSLEDNNRIWLARDDDGHPAAFLWGAHTPQTAIYLYGGSNDIGRKLYANYMLQWEALSYYHQLGVARYDLNGHVSDGVGSFKRKFTDNKVTFIGTYDAPLQPLSYRVYESVLPKAKPLLHLVKSKLTNR